MTAKKEAIAAAQAVSEARILVRNVLREWPIHDATRAAIDRRLKGLEMLYHSKALKLHETPRARKR